MTHEELMKNVHPTLKEENDMDNSLLIRIDASRSLNFLIYIQNIYLNQKDPEKGYKFPYHSTKTHFTHNFEEAYEKLWDTISTSLTASSSNDLKIFYDESTLFRENLFMAGSEGLKEYSEIHQSFNVWWGSFNGCFSVERSIDVQSENVYAELVTALAKRRVAPQKELAISLIYDELLVGKLEIFPYFAVLSTKDFFVHYEELIPKLTDCIC